MKVGSVHRGHQKHQGRVPKAPHHPPCCEIEGNFVRKPGLQGQVASGERVDVQQLLMFNPKQLNLIIDTRRKQALSQ